MKAEDLAIRKILRPDEKTTFRIPFFQRSYVWDEENWEGLLDDLLENQNHFLGSLIVKSDEKSEYITDIIDGQQRLTTLSILIKALYQVANLSTKKNFLEPVLDILFRYDSEFEGEEVVRIWNLRITHSKFDRQPYAKVIGEVINNANGGYDISCLSEDEIKGINDENHNILRCYKYFYNRIKDFDIRTIYKLLELLTTDRSNMLVLIKLGSSDSEQTIFDTVNNSGKKLTTADIIKNKLFQRALDLAGNTRSAEDKVSNLYSEWEEWFYKDEDFYNFWNAERATGRIKRTNMEIFLYCYAIIQGRYVPSVDNLERLDIPYKKMLEEDCSTYSEVENMIKEIVSYAASYIDVFKDIESNGHYYGLANKDNHNELKRLLLVLRELEVSTFAPFVLHTYYSNLSEEEKNNRYNSLQRFLVKNVLCGISTKNYNKNCVELLKDYPKASISLFNNEAYDNFDNENNLYKLKNKQATLILFIIELSRITNKNDLRGYEYIYSLEHIMPKDWGKFWNLTTVKPVEFETGNIINDVMLAEANRKKAIGSLGNMTLITKEFNSSLKNKAYNTKMLGDNKHHGYATYTSLSINKDIVDGYNAGNHSWNEQSIYNRLTGLIKEIKKIWF